MSETIQREAKLFEAGSYPERGLEITEADLDRIIECTSEAPVRIEHSATPFDGALGVVKSLYRNGRELFGKLCFTKAAWELIRAADARRLSVAISKDKNAISEVSLVREPRIADAAVFSEADSLIFDAVLCFDAGKSVADAEAEKLRKELANKEADIAIDELKRSGKLSPCAEVFARALLRSDDTRVVTFANAPTPVSQVFKWFIESQPKVIEFSELAPAVAEGEEPELFAKLGITTSQVEKHRAR